MMSVSLSLGDVATIIGIVSVVSGAFYSWVHYRLKGDFASASAVAAHDARLEEVTSVLGQVPRHDDLRRLEARVGAVETNLAGLSAEVRGVRDLCVRIDRGQDLLLQDRLGREQATR
jgi:hypothetical protein